MSSFASGVQVTRSPLHGDGVVCLRSFAKDDEVLAERPLAFLQTLENRQCNLICRGCSSFLGSLQVQLGLLNRTLSRQDQAEIVSKSAPQHQVVMCTNHCGELYCSELCRHVHWMNRGHALLCTGSCDATDSLVQFKIHAMETNEIFLLVADVFAQTCVDVERKLSEGCPFDEAVATSMIPFEEGGYVRELWWDAAVAPPGTDPAELRASLQTLVTESWGLLDLALRLTDRQLASVLSPEYMSRLIGMFEQNNVGVRMTSRAGAMCMSAAPGGSENALLASAAESISQVLESESWEDCDDENCQDDGEEEEGEEGGEGEGEGDMEVADDWSPDAAGNDGNLQRLYEILNSSGLDSIFPPLDGTAFYSKICKINHSCEPNVLVKYPPAPLDGQPRPLMAQLIALRDIAPNEELLQSYIDQSMSFENRQAALRDYGFECSCPKCLRRE